MTFKRLNNRCPKTNKKKSTKNQARREARYLKYNKKFPDEIPQAYHCKACGWWHVGNSA